MAIDCKDLHQFKSVVRYFCLSVCDSNKKGSQVRVMNKAVEEAAVLWG